MTYKHERAYNMDVLPAKQQSGFIGPAGYAMRYWYIYDAKQIYWQVQSKLPSGEPSAETKPKSTPCVIRRWATYLMIKAHYEVLSLPNIEESMTFPCTNTRAHTISTLWMCYWIPHVRHRDSNPAGQ